MSARNPKPTGTGGKKDPPKKPQPEKPQPQSSASKKTSTDKGNTSRSGGTLTPASPLPSKPSPAGKKSASPMIKKDSDKAVGKAKPVKVLQKPSQVDDVVQPLDPGSSSIVDNPTATLKEPPSRRMRPVETGQFTRRAASEVRPVATRPDLSPRSKRVHDAACTFMAVKKRECSNQKYMETFVMEMFPQLQANLKKVQELSLKVGVLPPHPPDNDDQIKLENDQLNLHISSASSLFKSFKTLLDDTRSRIVSFMDSAEQGTVELDNTLKVAITEIIEYSKPEAGTARRDDDDDDDDDDRPQPGGGKGDDKPGDDKSNLGEKKDGKPPGDGAKDYQGELSEDDKSVDNLSPPTSDSEPESDAESLEKFRKQVAAVLDPVAALASLDSAQDMEEVGKMVTEGIPNAFAATLTPLKEILADSGPIFNPMVECLSDPSMEDVSDHLEMLNKFIEGAKRTLEPLRAKIEEDEGRKGDKGSDVADDPTKTADEQPTIPEKETPGSEEVSKVSQE